MTVSVRELSNMLGCSTATISNALNFKKNVNHETAERIRKVAAEYGFKNVRQLTQIRFISYRNSGAIVSDTPFFSSLISGVESECKSSGLPMSITLLDKQSPTFEQEMSDILQNPGCGSILLATEMTEQELSLFDSIQGPLVVLDAWFSHKKKNTIQISNQDSAEEATNYLISMGHRNIGYLKSGIEIQNFKERYSGYARALLESNLNPAHQICYVLSPTLMGAYSDMLQLLNENAKMPTAFFADNDIIAAGCLRAFQEKGVKVPDDVSIVGFDDMPFTEICSPPLTTIKVPKEELGRDAVRRLKEVSTHQEVSTLRCLLSCELVKRNSVAKLETNKENV